MGGLSESREEKIGAETNWGAWKSLDLQRVETKGARRLCQAGRQHMEAAKRGGGWGRAGTTEELDWEFFSKMSCREGREEAARTKKDWSKIGFDNGAINGRTGTLEGKEWFADVFGTMKTADSHSLN